MTPEVLDPSSYDEWRNGFARERLRTLYYLGLTANPVFLMSDLLFYRDHLANPAHTSSRDRDRLPHRVLRIRAAPARRSPHECR